MPFGTESFRSKSYLEYDITKTVTYTIAALYVKLVVIVLIIEPFVALDCQFDPSVQEHVEYHNPQYVHNPCRSVREWKLLGLTMDECDWGRRLLMAVVFGSFIGWERRNADRPAGIRTMALVSLGSCLFSICSTFAFLSGPMSWDSSRVSAAIPSGVGFLGSALIFKHTTNEEKAFHEVHGLTTAAAVWLSAAVGIACAGGLYFVASLTTAIVLVMLRFGPRTRNYDDEDDDDEPDDMSANEKADTPTGMSIKAPSSTIHYNATDPEMQRILPMSLNHDVNSRRGLSSKSLSRRSLRPSLM